MARRKKRSKSKNRFRLARQRYSSLRVEVLEERQLLAVVGNNISVGNELQNYRLGIAATAEYTAHFGGQAEALTAIQTFVADLNDLFEEELSIHFDLVSGTNIIYTDAGSDPYSNGNTSAMLDENQLTLDTVLGTANYDIGHVFGTKVSGGSGLASLGVVGNSNYKAKGASVSSDLSGPGWLKLVGHEFGHQFGAPHSFNASTFEYCVGNRSASEAYEPASGTTIMSYAGICGADDLEDDPSSFFHAASYETIQTYIATANGTPHSLTSLSNNIPTISAGTTYTIPANTPFELDAVGADSDTGDTLTYSWEQLDLGSSQSLPLSDIGSGPLFRSFEPVTDSNRIFPRLEDLLNGVDTAAIGEVLPSTTRDLNFRVTVRDGQGGVNSDDVLVHSVNTGSAFSILSPNSAVTRTGFTSQSITWDVAGTTGNGINTANVDIMLSTDGGKTFPINLATTANDGFYSYTLPNITTSEARLKIQGSGNIFYDVSDVNFSIIANPSAPGVTITETGGSTIVGESGLVGGSATDTYTLALNTVPSSVVQVTVAADAQTEVSLDGTNFFSSVVVSRSDTSAQTITVRGLDDSLEEGIHTGGITHTVSSSVDSFYPIGMLINSLSLSISDDELQPVVGIDFDDALGTSPTNWTRVSQVFGGTTSNLIREDGFITGIGLELGVSGGAGLNLSSPDEVPLHSPQLDGIDGNQIASQSLTLTWTGLTPDTDYNLYLFVAENFGIDAVQEIVVTGGSGNPVSFIQDTQAIGNRLLVNSGIANTAKRIESDAIVAQADSSGEIRIDVTNISLDSNDYAILSGAAIQEIVPESLPGFTVNETNDNTTVYEDGTTDTFSVVLNKAPLTDVVLDVSSNDLGEATTDKSTLTFTPEDWDTAQTITITGEDDVTVDGSQSSKITISVNDATSDDAFDSLADQTVAVTTTDDDVANFSLSKNIASVSETGTTDSFTVTLDRQPLTDVVLGVSSNDLGEATTDQSTLTFTSANWDTAQTVTITREDDVLVDGSQSSTITISVDDANSDNAFDSLADQSVAVTTADDGDVHPPAVFEMALVMQPTSTAGDGSVVSVPVSMTEVHEWEEYYLEFYVQLPPLTTNSLTHVQFTLDFDSTLLQLDLANRELGVGIEILDVNSDSGQVTFSGTIQQGLTNFAADSPVLITRIPTSSSIVANVDGDYPDESNLSLPVMRSALVTLDQLVDPVVSTTAADLSTLVRAVLYDLNDNDRVDLADLLLLIQTFGQATTNEDSAYRSDFDQNGNVGLTDLLRLVNHFGYQQGDGHLIAFPIVQEPEGLAAESELHNVELVSNSVILNDTNQINRDVVPDIEVRFSQFDGVLESKNLPLVPSPSRQFVRDSEIAHIELMNSHDLLDQLFTSEDQLLELAARLEDDPMVVDNLKSTIDDLFANWVES
ncbi:MAG: reprolysin-like metallopeptidase [Pirellulales bacterium]